MLFVFMTQISSTSASWAFCCRNWKTERERKNMRGSEYEGIKMCLKQRNILTVLQDERAKWRTEKMVSAIWQFVIKQIFSSSVIPSSTTFIPCYMLWVCVCVREKAFVFWLQCSNKCFGILCQSIVCVLVCLCVRLAYFGNLGLWSYIYSQAV